MTTDSIAQHKLPETIMKRDGSEEKFDRSKISNAIYNSLRASGEYKDADINEFTGKLLKSVLRELKARNDGRLHVEDVQDIIENKLMDKGLHETARHFIKYRFLHKINRENADDTTLVDCNQTIDEYVGFTDWRIKANSNTTYSNAGLVNNTAGKVIANYWLDKVYSHEEGVAHRNGDYHIHDLDSLSGYCFTGDTKILLRDGDTPTIKELADKHGTHSSFAVLAVDANGKTVIGTGHNARLVKKDADLVAVKLSSSVTVRCTPDHEFMLPDGSYKQAKDLEPGEELKSVRVNGYYHVESVTELEEKEDVYCLTVYIHGNFALEAGVFVHNCAGWNLRALLNEGFNGVRSRVNSRPPKHFREALGQMANFLGILQSEWAGAQAFSSFDTFLAPYVFRDQLSYEEVKKAIRGFVYNLNVPSRWGQCVPTTYKCQLSDGSWKSVNELSVGDTINVFDITTGSISTDTLTHINKYDAKEKMHAYTGENGGYFEVTPNHRVVIKTENGYEIKESAAILDAGVSVLIPTPNGEERYTVKEVTSSCDTVWCPTTNTGTFVCMTDEGYVFITGNSPFTNVTIDWTVPQDLQEQFPTKGDNHIFADIADNEELMAIAKERGVDSLEDMCYKHFQPEMDIIQKAYYEVMTEGDSTGQPFTFPIPTVNITEDFDWEGKNVPILFENAAKIGSSYFQNFVGSQYKIDENGNRVEDEEAYKPGAIRSMCPLTLDTEVLTDKGNVSMKDLDPAIHKIYSVGGVVKWNSFTKSPVYTYSTVYKITFENGVEVEMSSEHLQLVLDENGERNVVARELEPGMRCLFISNPDTEEMSDEKHQITSVEKVGVKATQCIQVDSDKEEDSIFVLANGLATHNCRLQLDLNELRKRGNGLFGSAESTGSIGVVTINLARLGHRFKGDKRGLYEELDRLMDMAKSTLEKKRAVVADLFNRGLYPYTKRYLPGGFSNHFSTIGVNGGNEMIRNFTNDEHDITTEWGHNFAEDLLNHIRSRLKQYQNETGNLYNLEASPSEGCLVYDTEVLTIDGPQKIGDLCDSQVPLLSFNNKTKRMEYKKASVFLDSITEKVYKLTFDNGLTVECTSEHPFAVRHWNGLKGEEMFWAPASSLKVGDRIKGAYSGLSLRGYKKYGKNFFEHKGVYSYYKGEIPEGCVVHHKDENKLNNSIDNLELMDAAEHKKYHINKMRETGVMSTYRYGEDNAFYGKHHTKESRNRISDVKCTLTDEEKETILEAYEAGLAYKQISRMFNMTTQPMDYVRRMGKVERPTEKYPKLNPDAITYLFNKGYTDEQIVDILRGHNTLAAVRDVILGLVDDNHKVVSIEVLHKQVKVYNATVEDNQNFYVGNEELGYVLTHNTTYRFAREDLKRYPDIIQAGCKEKGQMYYTNSTQLPSWYTQDLFKALKMQDKLQTRYTGGCVFHMYMSEAISSPEVCRDIVRKVLTNFKMPYITVTPLFSVCDKHGYLKGQHDHCPLCDEEILEKYSE